MLTALTAAVFITAGPALALPFVHPEPEATASPHASSSTTVLPFDSSVYFILDDSIDSRASKPGTYVKAHLRDPLVVGGVTLAPAGAPEEIEVLTVRGAETGGVDGSVDIYFQALKLADGKELPLHTPISHLTPQVTSSQANTQNVTDTVGDIFIPYHVVYHILRKGNQVVLRQGAVMRARTAATLSATANGAIAVSTPQPFAVHVDKVFSGFRPAPVSVPPGFVQPTPKPTASPKVTPSPQPTSSP